ncbi:MAG: TonB-dependent receptor [Thermoanaerobaculia bacterium]|jgi:outer membrane receptor protein involved in Fe transport
MKLRNLRYLGALVLIALLMPATLLAQSGTGSLRGRVTDESGAALPGVTVTATQVGTGITRVAVSESDGIYHFPTLQVGDYSLKAELSGFGTMQLTGLRLNVASERNVDISLKAAAVQEQITVTVDAPLVQDTTAIGTVVSRDELENLPLNGRQFANLASLAPGTSLSVNSDPTKPGQLTVALNGGIGRNVNYLIDGGDNTDDTIGGALQNFNLEAVSEFKIQTQQYKAEYGRSSGGVLTVVTKTGSNELDGSVYGYFRDKSLNGETTAEKNANADKSPYERQQYGFAIGGPIVRDRAHFFATYEKTDRKTEYLVDSGGIDPSLDGQSFSIPFEDELVTAKATLNISPEQFLQVRYGYQKNSDKYGASSLSAPDSLGTVGNEYDSILAGHTWQVGSTKVNEALIQYTSFDNVISADSNDPYLYYPSGYHSGQNINTPQSTQQRKTQFKDDFSWSMVIGDKRHDMKAGINYIDEPTLGGDFSTGTAGQFSLLEDRAGSPVGDITYYGGFFGDSTPVEQYSFYVQDDWFVNDRLTVNAGLRYDYWKGFDLDQRSNPIWQELSTQTEFNDYYLKDFQGGKGGVLENDDNNWGPRIGFTYDLKGDAKSFIRGGWGIYYDFPYTNATILFPAAAVQSNYGVAYEYADPNGIKNPDGSYWQPGDPLPPNQIPSGGGVFPPNEIASPTLATPKATQASLGYSTEIDGWLGLTLDLVSIRYRDIPYRFRANPRLDANGNAQASRRFSNFGNFRLWIGDGEANYDGANLGVRARLTNKLELQGFYTYSETDGNVLAGADEFRLTDVGHQPDWRIARDASIDPLNPHCDACFGPLNTDSRHKVTLSALYRGAWDMTYSGVLRYRSALPYTRLAGSDVDGDGFAQDLAAGVDHVNDARGDSFSQVDLRLSKLFRLGEDYGIEIIGEVFNIFDSENPSSFDRTGTPNAYAGDPLQGEQRLMQLGARVTF